MSFLKKLIILSCFIITTQPAFAMKKNPFKGVFKNYASKTKSFLNKESKQQWPLNKAPKLSFATMKFHPLHWKKLAALGALSTGYGLYTNIYAQTKEEKRSWDSLSEQEKDSLAERYDNQEGLWNYFFGSSLTIHDFRKASSFEKDVMTHAIAQKLKQGDAINDLVNIYANSNEKQKDTLILAVAAHLKQGHVLDDSTKFCGYPMLDNGQGLEPMLGSMSRETEHYPANNILSIYCLSNESQKNILIPAIAIHLQQGGIVNDLTVIYNTSHELHKNSLASAISERIKHGYGVDSLYKLYRFYSNDTQRDILAVGIAEHIKQGHAFPKLLYLYSDLTNKTQRNILAPAVAEQLKIGYTVKDFLSFYRASEEEDRTLLVSAIIDHFKKEHPVDDISWIYSCISEPERTLFASAIAENLIQGYMVEKVDSMYSNSNNTQKNILAPAVFEYINQGHTVPNFEQIYTKSNRDQKKILFPHMLRYIAQNEQDIPTLIYCYCNSAEEHTEVLFSFLLPHITKEDVLNHIGLIYKSSTTAQKNILLPFIITYLEQESSLNNQIWLIYQCSNQNQKNELLPPLIAKKLGMAFSDFSKTQTGGHMSINFGFIYEAHKEHLANPIIAHIVKNIIQSEINYAEKGYSVFYHAQIWHIYWLELLYTKLWEIKHKQSVGTYMFTRFPEDGSCFENANLIQEQRKIRKKLLKKGRFDPYRYSLLFLNYALFGNSTNKGSCSFDYFLNNSNQLTPKITTADIFRKFNLERVYTENKEQFDKLEQEFLQLSEHGNMIQLAVPNQHLEKHLYLTTSGGPKVRASIQQDIINYGYDNAGDIVEKIKTHETHTDSVAELIQVLKTGPECINNSDKKEFAWIVTDDTIQKALEDGVEIKSFNTADPEKFENVINTLANLLHLKLVTHRKHPAMNPWNCYKKHQYDVHRLSNLFNQGLDF